jgi:hypothetical protein
MLFILNFPYFSNGSQTSLNWLPHSPFIYSIQFNSKFYIITFIDVDDDIIVLNIAVILLA